MVKVVAREQKDLEAAGQKGGLRLETKTERDRYCNTTKNYILLGITTKT